MLNPTIKSDEIFGRDPTTYCAARVAYPRDLVEQLLDQFHIGPDSVVADIGAGPGTLGLDIIAARHPHMHFVEPNERFCAHIGAVLPYKAERAHIHPAKAQATTLPDHSVDLIVIGDAAHWFSPTPTIKEFQRILKPGGNVAVLTRTLNAEHPLTRELDRLLWNSLPSFHSSIARFTRPEIKSRRAGSHLMHAEFHNEATFPVAYTKDEMQTLLGSLSFTADWVRDNPEQFRHAIIDPLFAFAARKGLLNEQGKADLFWETKIACGQCREHVRDIAVARKGR